MYTERVNDFRNYLDGSYANVSTMDALEEFTRWAIAYVLQSNMSHEELMACIEAIHRRDERKACEIKTAAMFAV